VTRNRQRSRPGHWTDGQYSGCHEVEDDQEEMIVEATLRIVRLKPWVAPDGMRFGAFTEYR
jgi:hypothetical protein